MRVTFGHVVGLHYYWHRYFYFYFYFFNNWIEWIVDGSIKFKFSGIDDSYLLT